MGIFQNKKCKLHRLNGVEDHLHLLISLNPSVALADFVRDVKTSTKTWIRSENIYENFPGWQEEYGAFTISHEHKYAVIEYIKNQESHHRKKSSHDELRELLSIHGVEYDEQYFN